MNLLPWREHAEKKRWIILFYCGFLIIITSMGLALIANTVIDARIQKMNAALLQKNILLSRIPLQAIAQNQRLRQQLSSFFLEAKKNAQENLQLEHTLKIIADQMPSPITLSTLTFSENTYIISGQSNDMQSIHDYSTNLEKSLQINTISLSDIHENAQNKSQFYFTLKIHL